MDDHTRALIPAPPAHLAAPPSDRRNLGRILLHIITNVEVEPLPPPVVLPDLAELPTLQRVYECLRLAALDAEQALSPGGHLRAIAKLACRVSVAAGVLSLCLAAVLAFVSVVLAAVVIITGQLVVILWNLLEAALLLVALLAVGAVLLVAVRVFTRRAGTAGHVRHRV